VRPGDQHTYVQCSIDGNTESRITHHYAGGPPFLFLKVKPPFPAFSWIFHGSPGDNIDPLGLPKVAQTGGKGPKGHRIQEVENEIT
jgi:hypothetical protein